MPLKTPLLKPDLRCHLDFSEHSVDGTLRQWSLEQFDGHLVAVFQVSEKPDVRCCTSAKQLHSLKLAFEAYFPGLFFDVFALQGLPSSCGVLPLLLLLWLCFGSRAAVSHA